MSQLPFPDTFQAQFNLFLGYSIFSVASELDLIVRIANKWYLMSTLEPAFFSTRVVEMFNGANMSRQREILVGLSMHLAAFDYCLYHRLKIPHPHKAGVVSMLLAASRPNYAAVMPLREMQKVSRIKGDRSAVVEGFTRKIALTEPSTVVTAVDLFVDQLAALKDMQEFLESFYLSSSNLLQGAISESQLTKATKDNVARFFSRTRRQRSVHLQRIAQVRSQLCMLHHANDDEYVLPVDARHLGEANFPARPVPDEFQFTLVRMDIHLVLRVKYTPENGIIGTEF